MDMGSAWEHPCQGFQISSAEVKGFADVALYADRFLICCTFCMETLSQIFTKYLF
jgi:hypothetical protein